MRSSYFITGVISIVLFTFLISCAEEGGQKQELLLGKWSLEKAIRNEKSTSLLKDLFFEFKEGGDMKTNFTGRIEQVKYTFSQDVIHQTEGSMNLDYQLESLTDSTLVIRTVIREIPFELYLKKEER